MFKKWSIVLVFVAYGAAYAHEAQDQKTVVININSKISYIDKNDTNLENIILQKAKEITHNFAGVRGVSEVETTVNRDCGDGVCKKEVIRCSECGGGDTDTETQVETKCPNCGGEKIVKSCSSCGKQCSSCSSCCK